MIHWKKQIKKQENNPLSKAPFAVIFDMDGVLLDTENIAKQCWKSAAETVGWEDWEKTYLGVVGNPMDVQQAAMNETLGEEGGTRFREVIREHFREGFSGGPLPVKTGAEEVLSLLHENGIPLAVASSTIEEIVRRNLTDTDLLHYFDKVIGGDQIRNGKPAPDIFLKAAEVLDRPPEECYVIEDSFHGIRAAHYAGCHPVMVPDVLQPTREIADLAQEIFPSLLETAEYFRMLCETTKQEN